jgi:hypothetical protein
MRWLQRTPIKNLQSQSSTTGRQKHDGSACSMILWNFTGITRRTGCYDGWIPGTRLFDQRKPVRVGASRGIATEKQSALAELHHNSMKTTSGYWETCKSCPGCLRRKKIFRSKKRLSPENLSYRGEP